MQQRVNNLILKLIGALKIEKELLYIGIITAFRDRRIK
jgi:hypothetical protein